MSISLNNIESRVAALEKTGYVRYPNYSKCKFDRLQDIPTTNITINDYGWLSIMLASGESGNYVYVNDVPVARNYFHSNRDNDSDSVFLPCYPGITLRTWKPGAMYNIILNLYYKFKEVISHVNLLK